MKTIEQIKAYKSYAIDGRDVSRLVDFIPESDLQVMGIELKPEHIGKHKPIKLTRKAVLSRLKADLAFSFEKALGKRGISASCMYEVIQMWNWVLEEGLEDFEDYPQYGLPLFKATAEKYGFPNPLGDDTGKERKYYG